MVQEVLTELQIQEAVEAVGVLVLEELVAQVLSLLDTPIHLQMQAQ